MTRKKLDITLKNVVIEAVAAEGKALCRIKDSESPYNGQVVFVEFAVPGDVVDIRILKKKKNYMEGRIVRMIQPSKDRLEPFCSHFGVCGGCKWQPLPYEMQLLAKQNQVYDQLVRIGHLNIPQISPIIGSEKTVNYRNKLEFTFSSRRWLLEEENPEDIPAEERCGLGFHVGKFFDKVLDIKHCHLQAEPSNSIRLFIKDYAVKNGLKFYDIRENHGYLRNLIIRSTLSGKVMLIVVFAYEDAFTREGLLNELLKSFPQITSLYYVINSKLNDSLSDQECVLYRGDDSIYENMEKLRFKIGPKSFYQTNTEQAYKLYSVVREQAALTGKETVYDLYTGTGTIAQFVSAKALKVIGIEYVEEAIADAKINATANKIDNCEFFAGDMKDVLTDSFIARHGKPDLIILDPPRAGIHPDVAKVILNAAPPKIVYVSCNPASQARDLASFAEHYDIVHVQPVDMFPHTQHVENVCTLIKKNEA